MLSSIKRAALSGLVIVASSAPSLAIEAPDASRAPAAAAVGAAAVESVQEKVDINKATAEELEAVPGIGPAIAGRIIEFREQNGPFEVVDDLLNVRGIGETTLEKLRPYLTVEETDSA